MAYSLRAQPQAGCMFSRMHVRHTRWNSAAIEAEQTETFEEIVAGHRQLLREQALQRLKKRRDFTTHLFAYVLINLVVWGVWLVIGLSSHSSWPWPVFVTLGWGIGITLNAWDVYMRRPITENDVQREMRRREAP